MYITKIALATVFAAGLLTITATSSMAETVKPNSETVDVMPMESCWADENGSEICSKSSLEPMPSTGEEVPLDGLSGENVEGEIVDDGTVDENLMYESGVVKGATAPDLTASNTLAAFGILVGILGALGIALSRKKEAK